MCSVLKVSRSGYYAWRKRPKSKRSVEDDKLKKRIKQIFKQHQKRYGVPRIHEQLQREGIRCGGKRVERLMQELDLRAQGKRPFKVTTNSKHKHPVAPNLLGRYFEASAPNQVWTGDITYIRTVAGWMYLAVVIDLFSRKVVGWEMSSRIGAALATDALKMAITNRKPAGGLIFHSDRGVQYASHCFRGVVEKHNLVQSMSRCGDCWDNAPTESFFATLKKELIRDRLYSTREEAMSDIFRYIEGYYNNFRLHSFLNYATPVEFEREAA